MSNAADLRAMALQVQAEVAAIEPRGFDSASRRKALFDQWDDIYEDYLLELMAEAPVVR
jgi:hypothetical protein